VFAGGRLLGLGDASGGRLAPARLVAAVEPGTGA
jgi:hypothetical protein